MKKTKINYSFFIAGISVIFCLFVNSTSVNAQGSELSQCVSITENEKRLACYDRLAGFEIPNAADGAVVSVSNDSTFGAESLRRTTLSKGQQKEEILASITKLVRNARDYATITLSNGQVWRQSEVSNISLKENNMVTVRKGALGVYYLSKTTSKRKLRVKRIK